MNYFDTKTYANLTTGGNSPDIAVVTNVDHVAEVDRGLNEAGLNSDEFVDVSDRFSYTVGLDLVSRNGHLVNVPYLIANASIAGFCGGIPTQGQLALVIYTGLQKLPIAIGGFTNWRNMRRSISDGMFPELKPGEVLIQSALRDNPMSFLDAEADDQQEDGKVLERFKGARVYADYKGRVVIESRHSRSGGSDGAFVQTIMGNPAATVDDDESNDFNEKDESNENYIALQTVVSKSDGEDPLFKFTVTQTGAVAFEFPKAYIGRASGDGTEPPTTVEIDVKNSSIIIDAEVIKFGRAAEESAVLGDTLVDMMGQLVDAVLQMSQATAGPGGPTTGPPFNASTFFELKAKLSTMLSKTNKVE